MKVGRIPDESLGDEKQLVNLIDRANASISVHVLAFSPAASNNGYYAVLDNALRRAATLGVKVRVMCADWSKRMKHRRGRRKHDHE
jgi:phosphatidylserine/phosphatidylglycerophosphate/cardiolipin synthase-like enzyme